MPTSAPVTTDKVRALQSQYGSGPFGQLMMNLALAPTPQALIDLTGRPETWLKAIEHPREIDPEGSFFHGLTSLPNKLIGKIGLNRGWFADEPAEWFGPHFAEAKNKDIPQPIIAAPRGSGMAKYDPPVEFSPAWAGRRATQKALDTLKRDLNNPYLNKAYPRGQLSAVKEAQHEISKPGGLTIPPEKLSYFNPLTGEKGPFAEIFDRLQKRMDPKEFQLFLQNLKAGTSKK